MTNILQTRSRGRLAAACSARVRASRTAARKKGARPGSADARSQLVGQVGGTPMPALGTCGKPQNCTGQVLPPRAGRPATVMALLSVVFFLYTRDDKVPGPPLCSPSTKSEHKVHGPPKVLQLGANTKYIVFLSIFFQLTANVKYKNPFKANMKQRTWLSPSSVPSVVAGILVLIKEKEHNGLGWYLAGALFA